MNKLKFARIALGAALAVGAMSAQALTLTAGNYKITLDNYDSGTLYGQGTIPVIVPPATSAFSDTVICSGATVAAGVAACDLAAVSKAPGSVGSVNSSADTMGIFSVAAISNVFTGEDMFIRGGASNAFGVGPYLTGVFGNLMDYDVTRVCQNLSGTSNDKCEVTAKAVGGTLKLWSNNVNYDPINSGPLVSATTDLNDHKYLPSVSGGTLFLEGVFASGAVIFGDADTSYSTSYNDVKLAGQGEGFLDFTGGAFQSFFDTDSLTNVNGGTNDAFFTTTFDPLGAQGWTVKSVGQVSGSLNVVPEPASLALVGVALLGVAGVARRRQQR